MVDSAGETEEVILLVHLLDLESNLNVVGAIATFEFDSYDCTT